ncbi:hypothetical protein NEMBOFW57_006864 [Staphylotrichum longicolle]|uniref:Protein kinase domain-containing protein n=1 Tax=Staphylotrichum longicolle TaxID=669026 RepID=A0AAD4ETP6_9PEZI|nr:hypothetical protein NEMBOFW57_006864 [Staphylotrichum longicolle]
MPPYLHHSNCHYIASGVTAEVYRAQARALKVIVETHNIEPHSPRREAKILSLLRASAAPNVIPLLETFQDASQRLVLPPNHKVLDIGGPGARRPVDRSYATAVDLWRGDDPRRVPPGKPLFESRAAHEDGNQLGLVLSIFQTGDADEGDVARGRRVSDAAF